MLDHRLGGSIGGLGYPLSTYPARDDGRIYVWSARRDHTAVWPSERREKTEACDDFENIIYFQGTKKGRSFGHFIVSKICLIYLHTVNTSMQWNKRVLCVL